MTVNYVCKIVKVTSAEYMHHNSKLKITTESKILASICMTIRNTCMMSHMILALPPLSQTVTLS